MPTPDGLRLIVIGPGRAGGSLALAATSAGHRVAGVLSRRPIEAYGPLLEWDDPLPEADLVLVSVKDDAVPEVVTRLEGKVADIAVVAHVSGFLPVTVLNPLAAEGVSVGGFHPLQTLPDAESGAAALPGSFVAVGGDPLAVDMLNHLAASLRLEPFLLEDPSRPAYHAAAAAAANFVVAALALSADLLESAHVETRVSRPLVERVVANVFEKGAASSLTGPIARGDIDTVIGHLTAAHDVSEAVGRQFRLMAEATTIRAGREEDVHRWR